MIALPAEDELEQLSRRGRAIYEEKLQSVLEPEHNGQVVAIHLDSEDYEVASNSPAATRALRARHSTGLMMIADIGPARIDSLTLRMLSSQLLSGGTKIMLGKFKDDHPRLALTLLGLANDLEVEFIIDTGFAGDLALPTQMVNQVEGALIGFPERRLATGQQFRCPSYEIMLDWNDESRPTEVLILEGDPLIGTVLLREYLIQIEMTESGQVAIEPL